MEERSRTSRFRNVGHTVESSIQEDPLLVAGLSFIVGYLIASGQSTRLLRASSRILSDFGSIFSQALHQSFSEKREKWQGGERGESISREQPASTAEFS